MRIMLLLAGPLALWTAEVPAAAADLNPYAELAALDQRVTAVSYRLLTSAAPWCPATQPNLGWALTDRAQYPEKYQTQAGAAYGAAWQADAQPDSDIIIAAVAPAGPAAEAQLGRGTAITQIDGMPLASIGKVKGNRDYARMASIDAAMPAWLADGAARLTLADGRMVTLQAVQACAAGVSLKTSEKMDAWTDGRTVQITAGVARYAADDSELAAVIAHELSHVILRHPEKLKARGVPRGMLRELGVGTAFTRETEREADRLSVWLLARSGYGADAAARFWRRYGPAHAGGLFRSSSHDSWRDRVALLEREAAAAKTALAADPQARPPLLDEPKENAR